MRAGHEHPAEAGKLVLRDNNTIPQRRPASTGRRLNVGLLPHP
jgi:hypothetical protein